MKIETKAVHAGAGPDPATGAIAPPIHLSTTFEHGPASEETHGYTYIRDKNPTQDRLEEAMSELEGGEGALVFSSGMGAAVALLQHLEPGAHVIFPADIYMHVRVAQREFLPQWRIDASAVDMRSLEALREALRPNTKLVWVETPSNPLMEVTDIAGVSAIARQAGALVAVDNTFATPILQQPLEQGADIILHSTTKFCGGHSDVQGGCLVFRKREHVYEKVLHVRTVLGAVGSPFNSWLVLRGLRTLACRMERHSANGLTIAQALAESRKIERVFYPGLRSHPGHEIRGPADERIRRHAFDSCEGRVGRSGGRSVESEAFSECDEPGRRGEPDRTPCVGGRDGGGGAGELAAAVGGPGARGRFDGGPAAGVGGVRWRMERAGIADDTSQLA
jgi:cystathionine gamma-synthase